MKHKPQTQGCTHNLTAWNDIKLNAAAVGVRNNVEIHLERVYSRRWRKTTDPNKWTAQMDTKLRWHAWDYGSPQQHIWWLVCNDLQVLDDFEPFEMKRNYHWLDSLQSLWANHDWAVRKEAKLLESPCLVLPDLVSSHTGETPPCMYNRRPSRSSSPRYKHKTDWNTTDLWLQYRLC